MNRSVKEREKLVLRPPITSPDYRMTSTVYSWQAVSSAWSPPAFCSGTTASAP